MEHFFKVVGILIAVAVGAFILLFGTGAVVAAIASLINLVTK